MKNIGMVVVFTFRIDNSGLFSYIIPLYVPTAVMAAVSAGVAPAAVVVPVALVASPAVVVSAAIIPAVFDGVGER